MFGTCRANTRRMTRQLGHLLTESRQYQSYRDRISTTAAVAGAGICGLTAYCFKEEVEKSLANLARQIVREKLQLHAAGKARKARRKARKAATQAGTSTVGGVSAVEAVKPAVSSRERRFLEFASVEYQGQAYMTPSDFLNAVVNIRPDNESIERRVLSETEVEEMLKIGGSTSKDYLRSLGQNGLISYTEYLFLLSILMKPQSSFRVAFNMFDTDKNQFVDKKEFLVIERIFANTKYAKRLLQGYQAEKNGEAARADGEAPSQQTGGIDENNENSHDHPHPTLAEKVEAAGGPPLQDTSLMRRFFGRRGKHALGFDDFQKFMNDLQTEILETEFNQFAHGHDTIKESDFTKLLLRHVLAQHGDYQGYLERVQQKMPDGKGITFEQYQQFCMFLSNLDDFAMAVKLYTFRDLPVSQNEFARAAKVSTGFALDPYVVDTIFNIFDINGDGRLSFGEFISLMRDRRKLTSMPRKPKSEWKQYKKCVREELKRY